MDSVEYTLLPGRYISPRVRDSNRWTVRMTEMSSTSRWDVVERVGLLSVCHSIWIRHFFWSFQDFPSCTPFGVFKSLQNMDSRLGFENGANICLSSKLSLLLDLYTRFWVDERLSSLELRICLIFILGLEWTSVCSSPELSVCLVDIGTRLRLARRLPDFRV